MVHIIPDSATLIVSQRPVAAAPVVEMLEGIPVASFRTQQKIKIEGDVVFGAEGGFDDDSADGWTAGLIQVAYCVEDWAYYRGERHTDGSVLVRRDVWPALRQRASLDCDDNIPISHMFCDFFDSRRGLASFESPEVHAGLETPESLDRQPLRWVPVELTDGPHTAYWTTTENKRTGKLNYLSEAAIELQFCTVLSVTDPTRVFHHLKHVYWGLRWHATFQPKRFSESSADFRVDVSRERGLATPLSWVHRGAPTLATPLGAKFAHVLTTPQVRNTNCIWRDAFRIADSSEEGPNRQQSATWEMLLPNR